MICNNIYEITCVQVVKFVIHERLQEIFVIVQFKFYLEPGHDSIYWDRNSTYMMSSLGLLPTVL